MTLGEYEIIAPSLSAVVARGPGGDEIRVGAAVSQGRPYLAVWQGEALLATVAMALHPREVRFMRDIEPDNFSAYDFPEFATLTDGDMLDDLAAAIAAAVPELPRAPRWDWKS